MTARTETLIYAFDEATARFEGHLLGALEVAESGGAIRILEVVLVLRDGESGELAAIRLKGSSGGLVAAVSEFRLDPGRREAYTKKVLDGLDAGTLESLRSALPAGGAVAAVLVEHAWFGAVSTAVERSGGRTLVEVSDEAAPGDLVQRAAAAALR